MDHITMTELMQLTNRYPGWCVSLYMPAHRAGPDNEQDPIRLKNLLREAEERLVSKGLRSPEIEGILQPAKALLQDPAFWRYQSDGLALFLSPEAIHTYRLPIRFDQLVVIADRFHLKPLLPFFANDGHFYTLALSQNQVRIFEGTRHTVDEIVAESMPKAMADTLQYKRFEKNVQFHTGTGAQTSGGERAAVFHGHDPSDEDKARLVQWFRKVNEELMKLIVGHQSPLVLAGVEYYFPLYRSASSYPNILEKGLPGNPDMLSTTEIHAGVWPLVEPGFSQTQKNAIARYQELTAQNKATSDLKQVVLAAHHSQVDTILVPVGIQVWGRVDPTAGIVEIHAGHETGDEDLLDLAAIQTLIHGGEVFALPPSEMPSGVQVAAVLRY